MPSKRKHSSVENVDDGNTENEQKRFAYLKSSVRRINENTIKSKWTTLPEPVQEKVRDLFLALERPVIVRQQNERKRIEAQSAVRAVVNNLSKRLPRMPFPPITKDSNFDYESAIDEHRSLEASLATMKDSADLLRAEIAKEESLLEQEKQSLQEMERNAKGAEAERKRSLKKEHPILRQLDNLQRPSFEECAQFAVLNHTQNSVTLDELDGDPDVHKLMLQLQGHLQSMQTNTAPLDGLSDAIMRSQAALDLLFTSSD
ncbi:hypothetical protein N7539_005931 [Penicillium diatomitis]|uniref:Kinetochore protein fta7 n=1 Tax=Penicillium diatomitis TaxID=2819901 RepID=A0A9X0BUB3_9EURO|nr:uncharacterized protein N7539_005931 [Penicillium diatomitis]KAJ5484135.1 hypothetical protein N7539_005931 [Penicillium diatomitis]